MKSYIYTAKDLIYWNGQISKLCKKYNIDKDHIYRNKETSQHKINKNLDTIINLLHANDRLIIMRISDLGHTSNRILKRIKTLLDKSIIIFIIDTDLEISSKDTTTIQIITSILEIEDSLQSKKNIAYQQTAKKNKTQRGRKSGKKTYSMFDKHKKKILKLHKEKLPISKILNKLQEKDSSLSKTSSQSLGQYIKRTNQKIQYEISLKKIYRYGSGIV